MNRIYIMWDKVTESEVAVVMAKNDKDCIRQLVFANYFKVNRLEDTEVIDTGADIDPKLKGLVMNGISEYKIINIEETLKALSIEMENKAEEIKGNADEVKEKIEKKVKKGGK